MLITYILFSKTLYTTIYRKLLIIIFCQKHNFFENECLFMSELNLSGSILNYAICRATYQLIQIQGYIAHKKITFGFSILSVFFKRLELETK